MSGTPKKHKRLLQNLIILFFIGIFLSFVSCGLTRLPPVSLPNTRTSFPLAGHRKKLSTKLDGVALLVADPPRANFTTWQNPTNFVLP